MLLIQEGRACGAELHPALLCAECAASLPAVPWALRGGVAVPKEGVGDWSVADRPLVCVWLSGG